MRVPPDRLTLASYLRDTELLRVTPAVLRSIFASMTLSRVPTDLVDGPWVGATEATARWIALQLRLPRNNRAIASTLF